MLSNMKLGMIAMAFASATLLSVRNTTAAEDEKVVVQTKPDTTKPDNTKINMRDRDANELTAGSQNQNKGDIEITAKIRQMVVKDETLSTNAHNIKIITIDGMVTLKGPVKNDSEKATVEKHAIHIVGEKKVSNLIEIAP